MTFLSSGLPSRRRPRQRLQPVHRCALFLVAAAAAGAGASGASVAYVLPKAAPTAPPHRGLGEPVTIQGGGTSHAGRPREATATATVVAMAAVAGLCMLVAVTAWPTPVIAASEAASTTLPNVPAARAASSPAAPKDAPAATPAASTPAQREADDEDDEDISYAPEKLRRKAAREAAKSKAPELPAEELQRRRDSATDKVKDEDWYQRGKIAFVAKCAGCHPGGGNVINLRKTLFWADMEKYGYRDMDKIKKVIRYGQGKMPGFAPDCAAEQDFTQCGVSAPLSEETLQDIQDFVINRANKNWKGR